MDGSPGTDTDRSSALRTGTTARRRRGSDGLLVVFIMCLKGKIVSPEGSRSASSFNNNQPYVTGLVACARWRRGVGNALLFGVFLAWKVEAVAFRCVLLTYVSF
ncbi:hypothetical protein QQF64_006478 [Cirrhinus molitorella]|uniref:N-acetyltransferase domain-containing protein n=1 Tax=Cirrhinus molitorella TaxID=172907 RepID=A0ABR3MIE2_9TELE